jgi:hypothetical protein
MLLDMFQITEAFDKYKSSMEKVGKALHAHSDNTMLDKIFFLELAVFSFLSGNNYAINSMNEPAPYSSYAFNIPNSGREMQKHDSSTY